MTKSFESNRSDVSGSTIVPQLDRLLGMYLHLARASQMRRQPMVRDKLLVLAGVTAAEMGLAEISAECRERVLSSNSWHLARNWPTFEEALTDPRFQAYFKQLARRYSPEKAEHLLGRLGIEMARERDAYFTDHEYAAALLGVHCPGLATGPIDVMLGSDTELIEPTTVVEAKPKKHSLAAEAPSRRRQSLWNLGWATSTPLLNLLIVIFLFLVPPVLIASALMLLVLLLEAAQR